MAHAESVKGRWFGRDRTLKQQLMGLDRLFKEVEGKTVLDVGCAEGAISLELSKSGAARVDGIEIREDAVLEARRLRNNDPLVDCCDFYCCDANNYEPAQDYDIVLMLALLHKLRDPCAACARIVARATDLVVIRLPPEHAPTIIDERSGSKPHHIGFMMERCGFELAAQSYDGPLGEWVGYYRRIRA